MASSTGRVCSRAPLFICMLAAQASASTVLQEREKGKQSELNLADRSWLADVPKIVTNNGSYIELDSLQEAYKASPMAVEDAFAHGLMLPSPANTPVARTDNTSRCSEALGGKKLLVLVGRSGCGKSCVVRRLEAAFYEQIGFIPDLVTKAPEGEDDARAYAKTDLSTFAHLVDENKLLAYASLTPASAERQDFIGIDLGALELYSAEKKVVLFQDEQGVFTPVLQKVCPDAVFYATGRTRYVVAPSPKSTHSITLWFSLVFNSFSSFSNHISLQEPANKIRARRTHEYRLRRASSRVTAERNGA